MLRSLIRSPIRPMVGSVMGGASYLLGQATQQLGGVTPYHYWDFINNRALFAQADKGVLSNTPNWSFSRASAGFAQTSAGVLVPFSSGELRLTDKGVLIEGARTNKCTNYNAAPNGSLTNISMTNANNGLTTLTELDDTAALLAAGLQNICPSGKVFKLDNSAGNSNAYVSVGGWTVNTNVHIASGYFRGSGGANSVQLRSSGAGAEGAQSFTPTATYQRVTALLNALAGPRQWQIAANAGSIVYFVLNQLEEGAFVSSPIVTAGASATRAADVLTVSSPGVAYPLGMFAEFERVVDTGGDEHLIAVDAGTAGERALLYVNSADVASLTMRAGAADQAALSVSGSLAIGTTYKSAGRFNTDDIRMARGGTLSTADTSGTKPTDPTRVIFGATPPFGYLRRAAIFNFAPSDAQLQAMTT